MYDDKQFGRLSGTAIVVATLLAVLAILALPATPAEAQSISLSQQGSGGSVSGDSQTVAVPTPAHLRTSSQGLVVENSVVAGGGVFVDLQGGFQNVMRATAEPDGSITTRCVTERSETEPR